MDEVIRVTGIESFIHELNQLAQKYPDRAGELLEKEGKNFRKLVINNVELLVGTTHSRKSLHKVGSYRVSKAKGIGKHQYVEISAKSPHFHLVEHGHQLIVGGKPKGFVPGKHMMSNAVIICRREVPKAVEDMVDTLLKERGLT